MVLKFASTPPTDPKDADMSGASPMLFAVRMLDIPHYLLDEALFSAVLDQIRLKIQLESLDKSTIIAGLQITERRPTFSNVALAKRTFLSALVKMGALFTYEDMHKCFGKIEPSSQSFI